MKQANSRSPARRADLPTCGARYGVPGVAARRVLGAQRFVSPFSFERMTLVKPSFLWKWVHAIEDVTPLVKRIDALRQFGDFEGAEARLPLERADAKAPSSPL